MEIRILRRIMLGLAAMTMVVTAGCDRRDDSPFGMEGEAAVSLSLTVDYAEKEMTLGTKNPMPVIDPHKDLKIHIENSNKDTLARWTCFDDVPPTIKFKPGAYKVVAEWGTEKQIPAFDTYSYRAEEKFVIKAGDNLHIDLTAKLATTKISVEFDSNFGFYYQDYAVNVRTVGVDSLRFEKDETRCGYFEPGSVRLRFDLVMATGQKLSFSPEPLVKANAADYYKLKLKVSSDAGSSQVIIVSTDETTNGDPNGNKIITIEIPKYFLPKDKPAFTDLTGFASGVSQSLFEGEKAEWSLKADVPGGIASFVIRVNDPSGPLAAKLGGQTVVDLASLAADSPLREMLKQAGFIWSPGLNSPEDASISATTWLDFTDVMVAQSDGNAAQYDFNVEVTDNYNQTPDGGQCAVKAEIKVPTVTFTEPVQGNIWATKGEFTIKANYDLVNGASPVLQFRRKTGTGGWNDAIKVTPENPDGDVTITSLPNEGGNYVAQYVLKGLQPNTEYEFRTVMNGRTSTEYSLTSEAIAQIPNSDFSDYTATPRFGGIKQFEWRGGWATRNAATTGQTEYSKGASGNGLEDPVSDVSSHSATSLVQLDDGSFAVQMQTTGWGRGTYSQQGDAGKDAGTWGGGRAGNKATGNHVANTTAGILYLGSYQNSGFSVESRDWAYANPPKNVFSGGGMSHEYYPWDKMKSETLDNMGITFASRPVSFNFSYLFVPKSDGGGGNFKIRAELIGEDTPGHEVILALAEWENGAEQATLINKPLPFTYEPAYHLVKATKLKVFFSSSVALGGVPATIPAGFQGGNPPLTWRTDGTRHTGNTLTIKSISLGYDW